MFKKLFYSLAVLVLLLSGCSQPVTIEEDGWYSSKEEVALYLLLKFVPFICRDKYIYI